MLERRITLLIIVIGFSLAAAGEGLTNENKMANWGQRKKIDFEQLQTNFDQPDMIYAPFAFWFWDTPLDIELSEGVWLSGDEQK